MEIIKVPKNSSYSWKRKIKAMKVGDSFQTDVRFQVGLRTLASYMKKEGIIAKVEKIRHEDSIIVTREK